MIIETVVTTRDQAGVVNCAPMGVEWGETTMIVKPYRGTRTFRNLRDTRTAVVNVTDNVLLLAEAAIGDPRPPTHPARVVAGAVLDDACSWREIEVEEVVVDAPRARIVARVVHRGTLREFLGYSRAQHAVLEASILASRMRLIPLEEIEAEFHRLRVIVDKTGGARERAGLDLLARHIERSAPR